jgi:hypothetical protein
MQLAGHSACALRLQFSRIRLFPGKIKSPFEGILILLRVFPAVKRFFKFVRMTFFRPISSITSTLVDIPLLWICLFRGEICALSKKNDYT